MSNWRAAILQDFVPNLSKLTLVADPDGLLTEEKLTLALRERGFALLEFSDAIEFRYAYESNYRSIWDRGGATDLVVILRLQDAELDTLPYDLLQVGRKLAFNLGDLFPNLSYPVVEKLDRSLLDALFAAQTTFAPDRLGDNATLDFILRHVFAIAAELIKTEVDLLHALLHLHYGNMQLPQLLADRLIQLLKRHSSFGSWPLESIVRDSAAFFLFLQERWPLFLGTLNSNRQLGEVRPAYHLAYPGPEILPFAHANIRVYIDNLFVERKLKPIEKPEIAIQIDSWMRSGILEAGKEADSLRIARLFKLIDENLPTNEWRYADWITLALKWAELAALIHSAATRPDHEHFLEKSALLNDAFAQWLPAHYASLINLPATTPAMVHHLPRRLARDIEASPDNRVALLVIDGLALDQWVTIRQILQEQDRTLVMRESAVFAWIPTLTNVSRQAIFAGKPPLYFPTSINSTNSEEAHWRQFWAGVGLSQHDVAYRRSLGDGDAANKLDAIFNPGKTRAIGLVIDKVDKIMHGMQLGAAGMHNQIKQWCNGGFLGSLISHLLDYNYQVWLTADHGNIECQGRGRPAEGVIAETRGERVRIYPTPELRASIASKFPFAHEWQPVGLPPDYFPLVAGGHDAFVSPDERIVGHGGIAMEEVIVPLVKFERKHRNE